MKKEILGPVIVVLAVLAFIGLLFVRHSQQQRCEQFSLPLDRDYATHGAPPGYKPATYCDDWGNLR